MRRGSEPAGTGHRRHCQGAGSTAWPYFCTVGNVGLTFAIDCQKPATYKLLRRTNARQWRFGRNFCNSCANRGAYKRPTARVTSYQYTSFLAAPGRAGGACEQAAWSSTDVKGLSRHNRHCSTERIQPQPVSILPCAAHDAVQQRMAGPKVYRSTYPPSKRNHNVQEIQS